MDTATLENLNHEWSPQEIPQTRRIKVILPQCYAALAIFAVNLSHVIFERTMYLVAYPMDIRVTSLVTYSSTMGLGLIVGGVIAQNTGARAMVMLAGAVSMVGWITLGWISSEAILQCMIYFVALTRGMMQDPSYVYLAEISHPNMRNALMAAICLSSNLGSIYLSLRDIGSAKMITFVNVVFALFGLVVMFFLPDSPYWLANKGRYHVVESSVAWFRGRTTAENVKSESKAIITNAQNSPTGCKLLGQKSFYIPALIVGSVFIANAFVGISLVLYSPYIQQILMNVGYHVSIDKISLVVSIVTVLLSIAFIVLVAIIGKRIMILISLFGGSIALLAASIDGYLYEINILSMDVYSSWFLLICLAVAYSSLFTGVIPVPLILNGEIFPSKLRNLGAGFGLFFVHMMQVVSNKFYLEDFRFAHGVLLAFALVSIFGFISLLWLFPRNENKSLVEIEHSSTSINELRRKKLVSVVITYE